MHAHALESHTFKNAIPKEHTHNVYHVVLYLKGKNSCRINHKKITTDPGTLLLLSPGIPHNVLPHTKGTVEYTEITFAFYDEGMNPLRISFDDLLHYLFKIPINELCTLSLTAEQSGYIRQLIHNLTTAARKNNLLETHNMHYYILTLFHALIGLIVPKENDYIQPVERVYQYILHNINKKITLTELSSVCGLSEGYLINQFKDKHGLTPVSFQHMSRCKAAANLLATHNTTVKEVAIKVGYSDVYHFTKMFKKHLGITPGKFLRSNRL
jgi:AraC-like DNA-binding protein